MCATNRGRANARITVDVLRDRPKSLVLAAGLLSRFSSVIPQQKTIALETLAKVIENYKKGRFDSCFRPETNLLSQLIQVYNTVSIHNKFKKL